MVFGNVLLKIYRDSLGSPSVWIFARGGDGDVIDVLDWEPKRAAWTKRGGPRFWSGPWVGAGVMIILSRRGPAVEVVCHGETVTIDLG